MTTAGGRERTGQWPRLLDELVALPSLPARLALLGRYGRLDEPGLGELLQAAEGLVVDDPRRADVLAEACAGGAVQLGARGIQARARYLLGELSMLHGRPRRALQEIAGARCLYAELGEELEALRTALGQMAVLTELGRYDEAERAGRDLLDQLDERELADLAPHGEERLRLRALAHQNLGVCHSLRGRYREALDAFTAAERRHRALGSRLDVAKLRHNRAMELLHLGRASEALALLEDAVATFREQRQTLAAARGLYEAGRARLRLGRYEDALAAFEQARGPLEELHTRADRDQLAVATADAYRALNLYDEALATYRTAEPSLRAAGNAHQLALALLGRGATLVATARLDEAEPVLAEATSLFAAADNLPLHATVLLERSAVADRRGDRQQALRLAWQAHDRVTGTEWTVEQVYGHLRLADLLLSSPRLAEEHLESAAALVRGLPLPHLRYQVDVRLGRLRHLLGRGAEARELLYRAVGVAEELRSALPSQTLRASFQRDKAAAYDHLVALELDELTASGRVQAFRWSERSRSRALADARAAVGAGRATDAAADHGGRIGQLRADLAAAHDALLSPALDAPDPHGARTVSLRRATELEHELQVEQLRAAAPAARPDGGRSTDALPLIETLDARGVASRLPADTTLLAYHALGDELVAFLVRGGAASHEPEVVRGVGSLARVQALLARLDAQWQRLHADAHFSLDQRERLRGAAERLLNGLYTQLLARLEPRLPLGDPAHPDHPSRLVVVPGAAGLQRVPFAALHDGHAPSSTARRSRSLRAPASCATRWSGAPSTRTGRVTAWCSACPTRVPRASSRRPGRWQPGWAMPRCCWGRPRRSTPFVATPRARTPCTSPATACSARTTRCSARCGWPTVG